MRLAITLRRGMHIKRLKSSSGRELIYVLPTLECMERPSFGIPTNIENHVQNPDFVLWKQKNQST